MMLTEVIQTHEFFRTAGSCVSSKACEGPLFYIRSYVCTYVLLCVMLQGAVCAWQIVKLLF